MLISFLRTVVLYLLLIVTVRLMGKRQIGELEPIELVLTLLISDLASVPMQDFALPLFNGVIPIITLIALSTLFSAISLRIVRFRDLVCGQPALVIVDGKLRQETMRRNRLTLDELFEQLRGQGITDLSDVMYAVLETNGRLSVLPRSPLQPVTPEQLGLDVQDNVILPVILINDGRVLTDNLRQAGRALYHAADADVPGMTAADNVLGVAAQRGEVDLQLWISAIHANTSCIIIS